MGKVERQDIRDDGRQHFSHDTLVLGMWQIGVARRGISEGHHKPQS